MPGFANSPTGESIMWADNVDFSGAVIPTTTVTTDGQLLIGSTVAPHIRVGNLTSSDSSITITNGSGTINLRSNPAVVPDLHTAKWIVNPTANSGGNQTTIAAAIAAASSGDTIFIMPGTTGIYTEDLTLKAGVNLVAFTGDGNTPNVTIVGTLTMTTAGTVSISNIRLQTNSAFFLAVTGSAASQVFLVNCYLNCSNNTGISYTTSNASSFIQILNCFANLGTTGIALFSKSSPGFLKILQGNYGNSGASTTASIDSSTGGQVYLFGLSSNICYSTSGSAGMNVHGGDYDTSAINTAAFAFTGTGLYQLTNSFISCGTATCVTIGAGVTGGFQLCTLNSSNTNAISGAGTLGSGCLVYSGTSSTVSVTTQNPEVRSNDALKVVTPGAYPYTTIPQDAFIKVDTSSARTIIPAASPVTGQRYIIKDTVGSAAANNITVTPSGKNIDGAASSVINVNYGSITIVYNGTEWSIV